MLAPWKKSYDKPKQHIKKQRHHFVNKGSYSQSYSFSSSHVWMLELVTVYQKRQGPCSQPSLKSKEGKTVSQR